MKLNSSLKLILLSAFLIFPLSGFASTIEKDLENLSKQEIARMGNSFQESDALSTSVVVRFPFEDVLGACGNKYTLTFKNFNQINFSDIKHLIREYFSLDSKSSAHINTSHFDSLIPFLHKFQKFMNGIPFMSENTSNVIGDINDEFEYLLRTKRTTRKPLVTLPLILDAHARLVASVGKSSEDEKAVFRHTPNPEYLFGLYENDAWKTPIKSFIEIKDFDNNGQEKTVHIFTKYITQQIMDSISKKIKNRVYFNIHYPMYGQDKLGIPFLTYTAIKRIYPFAYSLSPKGGAHGVPKEKVSAAGMSAHDFVHPEIDMRRAHLKKHISEEVDQIYINSLLSASPIDAEKISELYTPIAIDRFLKIESLFEWFFEKLVTEVLPQRGIGEFKKIMGGFFWVMRESLGFEDKIYGEKGLVDIIDRYSNNSLRHLNDREGSWEATSNSLNTNPIDGMSSYSTQEIIEGMKKENAIEKRYGPIKEASVVYSPSIEFAPLAPKYRFIDVKFKFMNGFEEKFSFTTMYHRITNIEDARNLLLWAGTNIPKIQDLNLLSIEEATNLSANYIDTIRNGLVNHINLFREVFKSFALEERVRKPSKHQKYLRWTLDQEKELRKKLK